MDLNLNDKVAVVTGASKGIGFAVVQALAAEGATVVAGARSLDTLQGLERVTPIAVDLSEREGPGRLIDAAVERHGQIDVLVNNVGAARVRTSGFPDLTDEDFEQSLQINFFAALRAIGRRSPI